MSSYDVHVTLNEGIVLVFPVKSYASPMDVEATFRLMYPQATNVWCAYAAI